MCMRNPKLDREHLVKVNSLSSNAIENILKNMNFPQIEYNRNKQQESFLTMPGIKNVTLSFYGERDDIRKGGILNNSMTSKEKENVEKGLPFPITFCHTKKKTNKKLLILSIVQILILLGLFGKKLFN